MEVLTLTEARGSYGGSLGSRLIQIIVLFLITGVLLCAPVLTDTAACQAVAVRVDSTDALPGMLVPIDVVIENEFPVASVIVPIRYDRSMLYPDSVSFEGSAVSPDHRYVSTHSLDSSIVRIIVLPTITNPMPVIFEPGGLIARIWFTVSPFAEFRFAPLDTAYVYDSLQFTNETFYYYPDELQASDHNGEQLYPAFTPGGIEVVPVREGIGR